MKHIWDGDWVVDSQNLKIRKWEPNFNPESHKTSMAYVWVQFPGLNIEYLKEKILLHIGKALGRPIKVDETTLKKEVGYYASILVEMDLAKAIPIKICVESKYGKFEQAMNIPNLPKFCYQDSRTHFTAECRNKRREQEQHTDTAEIPKEPKKIWRRVTTKKKPQATTGFDICFPASEIGDPSSPAIQNLETPQEEVSNSGKFHALQELNEESFNSHIAFPALSVEKLLNAASGAPSINKVSNIVPPIGKGVTNENVPKVKQKTQQGSIVTTS
ncbi:uncharacterized protein LOC113279868 [Papaver somniferum]|uniref:uncharacterized protein LOC113279868 n=1 Tax=Papaver somniferum TaxID=3469 RepID=UPI000E6FD00D|nr:uncharacterized protein LOC113279868 [Papaver somniferum]